jgi:hypothetical protein
MQLPQPIEARRRRTREKRSADNWLVSATGAFVPEKYEWRARELCSPGHRRRLAHTLRLIEETAFEPLLGRRRFMNLVAVRQHRDAVLALAEKLDAVDEAVTPAGILRVETLLTDGASALYGMAKSPQLGEAISRLLRLLEPAAGRQMA